MKQAVKWTITSCTRMLLPHLLMWSLWDHKRPWRREGDFTEPPRHQLSPYHISKITQIFFITTVIGIRGNLYETEIQAPLIQMLPF